MKWLQDTITGESILFLVCFIGGCGICMVASKLWRGGAREGIQRLKEWAKNLGRKLLERGRANEPAMVALVVVASVSFVIIASVKSRMPIVTEHNLRIEKQVGPNQWWIVSDEHPDGFMYYACGDFDNGAWIYAGYYARKATWQVRGDCNSIRDPGLEFDYAWKADGHAKTIKEAGYE